jgi:hypothetical protein
MKPWRIGGDYDRPVPRRLVESAGVPRELYGQNKKAITQPFWLPAEVKDIMQPDSYKDLKSFVARADARQNTSISTRIRKQASPFIREMDFRFMRRAKKNLNWYNAKLWRLMRIKNSPVMKTDLGQTHTSILYGTLAGLKFHWAIDKMTDRYRPSNYRKR